MTSAATPDTTAIGSSAYLQAWVDCANAIDIEASFRVPRSAAAHVPGIEQCDPSEIEHAARYYIINCAGGGALNIESGSFLIAADGKMQMSTSDPGPVDDLVCFIMSRRKVYPFGRCPECNAIFARERAARQTFCSVGCAAEANVEHRRAKVRQNVRNYRQRRKNSASA